jgi:DNA-binding transcriptional MerR regulator
VTDQDKPDPFFGLTCPDDDEEYLLKIGEVADRVGLSLRTIRFYEEEGLVLPEARTAGGFRLYSRRVMPRLAIIKRMKPLGFSVGEMGEVLGALDELAEASIDTQRRARLVADLDTYRTRVEERAADLVAKAGRGREFSDHLRDVADQHR